MADQNELIWACSNDYDTEIRYEKGTATPTANQGVCAGLAIEWCKNILGGKRPELSKPFLLQGMLYQRFYDWGATSTTSDTILFDKAGVEAGTRVKSGSATSAARRLWKLTGVFWGGYSNHAVAWARPAGKTHMLFFDPNFGCYAVHSESRLRQLTRRGRDAVGAQKYVEYYPVT